MSRCFIHFTAILFGVLTCSQTLATVISTFSPTEIADFQSGRVVIDFDDISVPAPYHQVLNPLHYDTLGIEFRGGATGSTTINIAQLPQLGTFPGHSTPNIIGGGTSPVGTDWRESIRFDFPGLLADAIGALSDGTGSNTTLTAYALDGSVITSVSGDQGSFLGIEDTGISYAVWSWNFDQTATGFSLDDVTFSLHQVPEPSSLFLLTFALVLLRRKNLREATIFQ